MRALDAADRSATVVRLADPAPAGAGPGQWWPPVMVDAGWVRAHADEFDLLHVHFGTESFTLEHLAGVVAALREVGKPLVYTVHDLENPQLVDQGDHAAQLDLLVPAADVVLTLTPGAAAEVARRWGREAVVVAHPDLLPLDAEAPSGRASDALVVGAALRDLRPNIDAVRAVETLLAAAELLRRDGTDVVVRVDLNERVRDEEARARVAALVASDPHAVLDVHPRLSDDELAASLADLDVAVLPYRHGTHSGWVELCWDLGVPVAGPRVGYAAEQHPDSFAAFDAGDPATLAEALRTLTDGRGGRPGSAARAELVARRRLVRRVQRRTVAATHDEAYAAALRSAADRSGASAPEPRGRADAAEPGDASCRDGEPLRIAVVAPLRYPIRQPHAGGLESSVWNQVRTLRARGHHVVLCAPEGSDFLEGGPTEFTLPPVVWDDPAEATDTTYPAGYLERALPALDRALAWVAEHAGQFDVVENHSLHGLPLSWAGRLGVPVVSTLHTPTLPDLLEHHARGPEPRSAFLAVSDHTAREWRAAGVESLVLPNGVDTDLWPLGPGGDDLVWSGRLVPEKGADLAIAAARRTGRRLVLAGRVGDAAWFEEAVEPHLGDRVRYVGELDQRSLADLVGRSACALVTPVWEEPFGLVIAEALAVGTPVAAFDTGGVSEVVGSSAGAGLVAMGDADALAHVAEGLAAQSQSTPGFRARIREDAVDRLSLRHRAGVLEGLYRSLVETRRGVSSTSSPSPVDTSTVDTGTVDTLDSLDVTDAGARADA
ncbi:glycosyltransferase [Frigoribacterium sp. NBH87]|uniref:glycosyltransferase n=1 Tax=Frigoribacterium sp. NBH87 TaxID=2596916 RepID=UPI001623A172|nr:glycosyltransferase [Frigoribacterium sp. NBH87]QNE42628.1 glycosyltransferase [Frigoribacterium sp. NBH87]